MLKMAHISAVALAGLVALSAPAWAKAADRADAREIAQETERVDRTVQIRAGGQLRLKNFSGRVVITGSRRGDVAIHAVRHATRDRLDHIKLEVRETASGISIEANKKDDSWTERDNNVVETEFDIQVPEDVTLDIDVFSSDIKVTDVTGRQQLKTFSADIEVAGAAGSIDAETFSGDIQVKLANGAGGHVNFDSFSGSLSADSGMVTRSSSRRRVTGDIGSGNNDYHFKTFSGDVRIRD
jgi:putative adhesin